MQRIRTWLMAGAASGIVTYGWLTWFLGKTVDCWWYKVGNLWYVICM